MLQKWIFKQANLLIKLWLYASESILGPTLDVTTSGSACCIRWFSHLPTFQLTAILFRKTIYFVLLAMKQTEQTLPLA